MVNSSIAQSELPAVPGDPIRVLLEALDQLRAAMSESTAATDARLASIDDRLTVISKQVRDMDERLDRQELRLASIESFPLPPIKQPSRLYATEAHSVSLAKRVKLGYAG